MKAIYSKTNTELVEELGVRFKEYRVRYDLSQKEVAEQTGLSVFTISAFESGKSTGITLVNFLKLLRALDELEQIESLLPELPQSPRQQFLKQTKTRVRKNTDEK